MWEADKQGTYEIHLSVGWTMGAWRSTIQFSLFCECFVFTYKCFFKRETFECGRLSQANMLTLTSNSRNVKEDTFWPTEIATILF